VPAAVRTVAGGAEPAEPVAAIATPPPVSAAASIPPAAIPVSRRRLVVSICLAPSLCVCPCLAMLPACRASVRQHGALREATVKIATVRGVGYKFAARPA